MDSVYVVDFSLCSPWVSVNGLATEEVVEAHHTEEVDKRMISGWFISSTEWREKATESEGALLC